MTNEVLITVSGLHLSNESEQNTLEITTRGTYYNRNSSEYIIYDEYIDDIANIPTNNMLKIASDAVVLRKKGFINTTMTFKESTDTVATYTTIFGTLLFGISTSDIYVSRKDDSIELNINYSLSVNNDDISNCTMNVKIESVAD